jgi:acyl-CoA thioesterase
MMADSILAAEYTVGSKRYPPTLYINRITDGRRSNVAAFTVSGKREARQLAKQQGAEPWNF